MQASGVAKFFPKESLQVPSLPPNAPSAHVDSQFGADHRLSGASTEDGGAQRLAYWTFGDHCNLAFGFDPPYGCLKLRRRFLAFQVALCRNSQVAIGSSANAVGIDACPWLSVAITVAVLPTLSWFHRCQADEALANQIILSQISVLTRQINNLKLTALQKQDLTSTSR